MLLNNFYTVLRSAIQDQERTVFITIHPDHPVFEGHFPGQPIVPGVCMVQIVKELLEQQEGKNLFLRESSQMKFLQLLTPSEKDELGVTIQMQPQDNDESLLRIAASIRRQDVLIFKMQGIFSESVSSV